MLSYVHLKLVHRNGQNSFGKKTSTPPAPSVATAWKKHFYFVSFGFFACVCVCMLFLFCLRMGPIALGMCAEVKYAFMWKMLMDKSTFFVLSFSFHVYYRTWYCQAVQCKHFAKIYNKCVHSRVALCGSRILSHKNSRNIATLLPQPNRMSVSFVCSLSNWDMVLYWFHQSESVYLWHALLPIIHKHKSAKQK